MKESGGRRPPGAPKKRARSGSRERPPKPKGGAAKAARSRTPRRARAAAGPSRLRRAAAATGRWLLRILWRLGWRMAAAAGLVAAAAILHAHSTLPEARLLLDGRARGSVTLLDRNGRVFAWRGDQFGGEVTADAVSPHLRNAVVAVEDKRFYRHFGLSPRGMAGAMLINVREGRGPLSGHGGSTITQQTAKLLCLGEAFDRNSWDSERAYVAHCRRASLGRKIREMIYAVAMELKYSKGEILSIYLNRAYMGSGAHGAEAAAQRYFGKGAADLDAAESAMLAGLLTAPSRLAPTSDLKRARDRAATALRLMHEQGYLSAADVRAARENPASLSDAAEARHGGHFADWVMEAAPSFVTRGTTEDVIVRTTLDPDIQRAAEAALRKVFDERVRPGSGAEAAAVVMSRDGAVRAMVGGRAGGAPGGFNRVTMARRQTGSAFKPFVYAAALEAGYGPNSTVVDAPHCIDVAGSDPWCPRNHDREHLGRVTLGDAFMLSLNVPAAKVFERVGRDAVLRVSRGFGLPGDLSGGPAVALGASESSLLEMTGAYAGILGGGVAVAPYGLVDLRLRGDGAPLMERAAAHGGRAVSESTARRLVHMLRRTVAEGTGRRAALPDRMAAGKTGTTQAARDAWFVGFTGDYVAGVWMGYDDNSPLTGVTGGGLPAEIWRETMQRIHAGLPPSALPVARGRELDPAPGRSRIDAGPAGPGFSSVLRRLLGQGE